MIKWLRIHKFSIFAFLFGLIMLPITYDDFITECSSSYECCVYCFISIIAVTSIGALCDCCFNKECEK